MRNDATRLSAWLESGAAHHSTVPSPKLTPNSDGAASWYRYYAGYADSFVAAVVGQLAEPAGMVLDPWNGSGTTTSVAALHGIEARGFDINPAAVVIAKARLLQSNVAPSLMPLTRKLLTAVDADVPMREDDRNFRGQVLH